MKQGLWLSVMCFFLAGCASNQSANMLIGNDLSYLSLSEQRQANLEVDIYEVVPSGAKPLGRLEASRCHRDTEDIPPSDTTLHIDLRISAWARGANGIANIEINKTSGILKNCWHIVTATADSFLVE